MKGAFFLTWTQTYAQQLERQRLALPYRPQLERTLMFDTAAERDARADELREEGYDVKTSDGT